MQGKVILVVGATGGIGAAICHQLAKYDLNLVLAARNVENLTSLANSLPINTLVIPTDITKPEEVQNLVKQTVSELGKIDVLINAAGAGILKQYQQLTPTDLDYILDLNLKGNFYTSQAVADQMKIQKSGHICNVVGILGKHPMAMAAAYCASKFGVVGFSKCMADELKRFGVKFTLFYFGGIDSPFWDNVSLKVDRSKMLSPETAANSIIFALTNPPDAVPFEITIMPDSHLFI